MFRRKQLLANRQLTAEELKNIYSPLIVKLRKQILKLSKGDEALVWALRRKLFKELMYDERGKPMQRRKLKGIKRKEQNNKCANCGKKLPEKYTVLDRIEAMKGYTQVNTRLLCPKCDSIIQQQRGYK